MQDARSGFLTPAVASGTAAPAAPQFLQRPPAAIDACLRAVERVEQVVEQETCALQQRKRGGLDDFNRRKSHGLLDLTRAIRALGGAAAGHSLQPRLQALQGKLKENAAVLKMHLEAVQEISAVMARAIRDGESDGTYSAAIRFPGGGR
jgi:hypothetical protein